MLNSAATSYLSDAKLSILPTKCQAMLKKLVCSRAYLKCKPGVNLADTFPYATWNYNIYHDVGTLFPLPFQRPCMHVCTDVGPACMGALAVLGMNTNCTHARYDYSNGLSTAGKPYQYDATNNANICNNMSASFQVAATKETYLKSAPGSGGACSGIISELWVPPAQKVDSTLFAPMQPPYFVQTILEKKLSALMSQLPVTLSAQCHLSLRKFFCGSYMTHPQVQVFQNVLSAGLPSYLPLASAAYVLSSTYGVDTARLLPYSFYMPSYPHQDVCLEYQQNCGSFAAIAGVSALVANCSALASAGTQIKQFPSVNQTIDTLSLSVKVGGISATVSMKFQTSPNTMTDATDASTGYTTQCPYGSVVPDDPSHPRVTWVTGTGCALACRYLNNIVGYFELKMKATFYSYRAFSYTSSFTSVN
jgi:hypothetical protein